jgi:hypothetical protein
MFNKCLVLICLPEPLKSSAVHLSPQSSAKPLLSPRAKFILLCLSALIIYKLPWLGIPFNWLATFFHEISHGLAALLTGGSIVSISLAVDGSGQCITRGGSEWLISFSGYFGAVVWGMAIYRLAHYHNLLAGLLTATLCSLLALTMLFYVRDLLTLLICMFLLMLFSLSWKLHRINLLQVFIKFIALLCLLNSLYSPLYLLDGQAFGDGANLARLTGLPEIFWIGIWSSIGLGAVYLLWKKS